MEFAAQYTGIRIDGTRNNKKTQRKSIIAALVLIGAIAFASAQLTYHLDGNTNSYTLQTPNSQQTFTRYFGQGNGNGNAAGPIQAAQSQQQVEIDLYINIYIPMYFRFHSDIACAISLQLLHTANLHLEAWLFMYGDLNIKFVLLPVARAFRHQCGRIALLKSVQSKY